MSVVQVDVDPRRSRKHELAFTLEACSCLLRLIYFTTSTPTTVSTLICMCESFAMLTVSYHCNNLKVTLNQQVSFPRLDLYRDKRVVC